MKQKSPASRNGGQLTRNRRADRKASSRKATSSKIGKAQKSAGVNRSEGIRLFQLAGRPTKEQFIRVYGERGPKMTWEERAATGVPAEKFQSAGADPEPIPAPHAQKRSRCLENGFARCSRTDFTCA